MKLGFKKAAKEKVKKGGMTHLKFRDAVRALKFERTAADLSSLGELLAQDLESKTSTVLLYNTETQQKLSGLGAFKRYQHHELFRSPVSMVTENTVGLYDRFVSKLNGPSKNNRLCLLGEKGVGKSTLLGQTQALALSKLDRDVVLLHFDHPERIVEGSSDYIFNKKLDKFQQPMFTKRWIQKIRAANAEVFKKMPLTRDLSFVAKKVQHSLKKGENSVYDFLLHNHDFGVFGPTQAFQFFVEELQAHADKFPVFVSVDNFNALVVEPYTKYHHSDMKPVHFTEFEVGHFLANLVSGDLSFAQGGVLLAESKDLGEAKTLRVGLGLQEGDLYDKKTQCDLDYAATMARNGGVEHFSVQNLSKDEARVLLQFWSQCGVLQIRDYPTKQDYKTSGELASERSLIRVGEFAECSNPEEQLENILQASYFVSSGNPGGLVQYNNLMF